MNKWAAAGIFDANFLCVCVLGDPQAVKLAREMGNQMKLTHCVNGFVDSEEDLPDYGQLGCGGFIVLDGDHRAISKATSAFMEVRDLAFHHVEAILAAVTAGKPPPAVCPGEYCRLEVAPDGQEKFQGEPGICKAVKDGLLTISLLGRRSRGKNVQVPPSAVRKINQDGSYADGKPEIVDVDVEAGGGDSSAGNCDPEQATMDGRWTTTGAVMVIKDMQITYPSGRVAPLEIAESSGCGFQVGYHYKVWVAGKVYMAKSEPGKLTWSDGSVWQLQEADHGLDEAFLQRTLGQMTSTKVQDMDDEHEECAEVLHQLAALRSQASIVAVEACLAEHFSHEEALFDEFGFGEHKNEKLSAKKTHIADHNRILAKIRQSIAEGEKRLAGVGHWRVPAPLIKEVIQDFHEHSARYDVQYSDVVNAGLAAKQSCAPQVQNKPIIDQVSCTKVGG